MNIRLTKNAKVGRIDGLKGREYEVDDQLGDSIIRNNRAVEIGNAAKPEPEPKAKVKRTRSKALTSKDSNI